MRGPRYRGASHGTGALSLTLCPMATSDSLPEPRRLARYGRIAHQLAALYTKVNDPLARMASAAALLHAKMAHHSWTGFYRLVEGDLLVGPYQGPLACMQLERGKGVCWSSLSKDEPLLVPDVSAFEGHIACDPSTRSEVVVPVHDGDGKVCALLDVDSEQADAFGAADVEGLTRIAALVHA
jgi:L-methionine (R)-S-oxide reductase